MDQYKCQKCKTDLIELEPNYEGMTDGQMADYDAGFNHTFYCPKCKSVSILDGEDTYGPDDEELDEILGKGRLYYIEMGKESYKKQQISEAAAKKYFKKERYDVAQITYQHLKKDGKYETCVTSEAKRIFRKAKKNIPKILGLKGLPDLVCLDNKKLSFAEVKNSYNVSCKPKPHQIMKFNQIKKMKLPMKMFVYEGEQDQPDILDWKRTTPKLFKQQSKKKKIMVAEKKEDNSQKRLDQFIE